MTMGMNKPHRSLMDRPSPWTSPAREARRRKFIWVGIALYAAAIVLLPIILGALR